MPKRKLPPGKPPSVVLPSPAPAPGAPNVLAKRPDAGGGDSLADRLAKHNLPPDATPEEFLAAVMDGRRARRNYTAGLGAGVLRRQMVDVLDVGVDPRAKALGVTDEAANRATAKVAVASILDETARDPLEEMLVAQMVWTHGRAARLSLIANGQEGLKQMRTVHELADRASNTFRRLLLALADYRNPRQGKTFIAAKQANVAQQQIVNNADANAAPDAAILPGHDSAKKLSGQESANEQGIAGPAAGQAALPAVGGGAGVPPGVRPADPAVAAQHRTEDAGG